MAASAPFSNFRPGGQGMVFLLCFLLASAIWVINALSKTYATTYSFTVVTTASQNQQGQKVEASLRGSGFALLRLYYRINGSHIEKYTTKQVSTFDLTDSLIGDLKNSVQVIRTDPPVIAGILTDDFRIKKVPIKGMVNVSFAGQFGSILPVMYHPDSIEITGPLAKVDSIIYIETESLRIKDLDKPLFRSVRLKQPSAEIILPRQSVWMYVKAERFTEQNLEVPVIVSNTSYRPIPDKVQLRFHIPLSLFDKVEASDFRVVADASGRIDERHYALSLARKPAFAKNVKMIPENVSLLIFD